MKLRNSFVMLGITALFATSLVACGASSNDSSSISDGSSTALTDSETQELEKSVWEFAVAGKAGSATPAGDNLYDVTLQDVNEKTVAFTDSPELQAKHIDTVWLPALWTKMWPDQNPNGILSYEDGSGERVEVVVVIQRPWYDANTKVLTFKVSTIDETDTIAATFTGSELYIDPSAWQWLVIGWDCGSAIVDIILAAIQEGADPLSDVQAIKASASCIEDIAKYW